MNRPCVGGYATGCRCAECLALWTPYSVARQRAWRRANPEKYRAQGKRYAATARRKKLEERSDAEGAD